MRPVVSSPRPYRLIYLLSVAQRRVQRAVAASSVDAVPPAQAGLLFVLGRQDGALMGEAGAALDLGPAGISGLVDRMAAAGLVERRSDPSDARASRIFLTAKGRKALVRAKDVAHETNARLMDGFSVEEIDIVARWLTSIQRKFSKGDGE
ncbi:MarR family transcriptional regulator [Bradyrhizobium sp. Tv2a-2]|uniref:MarR family winged helix-turn-helix transcriptional regulator n=1 Tax=Bradyrhizobium sp. Tv2a-2 TaxID=113395 RepID=UPI000467EB9B|nr:MarR family transcriptional regulator [Bradyrhizobium sp. Tv2a-2]